MSIVFECSIDSSVAHKSIPSNSVGLPKVADLGPTLSIRSDLARYVRVFGCSCLYVVEV